MYFPDKLRLIVTVANGFVAYNKSGYIIMRPEFYMLDYLSKRLKFNYEITEATPDALLPGLKEHFDIGMPYLFMYEKFFDYVHFTVPYHVTKTIFMCEKAGETPKFDAFLYPFHFDVWIFCLCFALVATVVSKYMTSLKQQSVNIFLNLVGSLLKQPLNVEINTLKKQIWWATWLVCAGVMSFLYNAIFLNFLTIPINTHNPKNFQELSEAVQNKKLECITTLNQKNHLLESREEHLRLLGEIITKNEWYFEDHRIHPIVSKTKCWIDIDQILKLQSYIPPKILHFSDDNLKMFYHVVFVRKSFCCFEQLNNAVLNMIEGGFAEKFYADYLNIHVNWRKELRRLELPDHSVQALGMEEMKYPIYLLLFCYTFCIIVFLFEILLPKTIMLTILSNKYVFK
ncbi:hypothetical protein JTE90_013002 [Oedothorax gibbosus]|uniref:Ionotropic receptor n=1 Tax=Oedothorax gibbosus TaxID=931172 RepID=A0AAV6UPU5_9ARAC|nr:hypothetical protein JTE90_013002 [Oedothorax gibbosus]